MVDGGALYAQGKAGPGMRYDLSLDGGIGLSIDSGTPIHNGYATSRIQKGWLLSCDGQDLSEEAVGFGVPIIKRGLQTIFPGAVHLSTCDGSQPRCIAARYTLNLEERLSRPGSRTIDSPLLYRAKNLLAGMIRGLPAVRRLLTSTSSLLRSQFSLQTTYEASDFSTEILLTYTIHPAEGKLKVELSGVDLSAQKVSEIILMNEQGAHYFDRYQEADGQVRLDDQIGCWDEVTAASAAFISPGTRLSFSLSRLDKAQLYRGRELVGKRLAWSGFGYSIQPDRSQFSYDISIRRLA
jgi:hypothetical protein